MFSNSRNIELETCLNSDKEEQGKQQKVWIQIKRGRGNNRKRNCTGLPHILCTGEGSNTTQPQNNPTGNSTKGPCSIWNSNRVKRTKTPPPSCAFFLSTFRKVWRGDGGPDTASQNRMGGRKWLVDSSFRAATRLTLSPPRAPSPPSFTQPHSPQRQLQRVKHLARVHQVLRREQLREGRRNGEVWRRESNVSAGWMWRPVSCVCEGEWGLRFKNHSELWAWFQLNGLTMVWETQTSYSGLNLQRLYNNSVLTKAGSEGWHKGVRVRGAQRVQDSTVISAWGQNNISHTHTHIWVCWSKLTTKSSDQ